MSATPVTHYLKEYCPPNYLIERTGLEFDLGDAFTQVTAVMLLVRNPDVAVINTPLRLDGEQLELVSVALDGRLLVPDVDYELNEFCLTMPTMLDRFELTIITRIRPQHNTELQGLYLSSGSYCTQCEAEGFRRITYYLDRPDVMSVFTTRIIADVERYPVMLSNGNLIDSGSTGDGRHWTLWQDPFPKPSYLFALVAGQLSCIEDDFVTASGREVALYVYVEPHNITQCDYAMDALKRAMSWDEQVYGREYDLERYMIVAVDDFNMGAMENKGLNIFNSKYVLASPQTATDADYMGIESVVAHEYFHNWSGNRVTCRDWFQLSLKEGFTVFRDQQFSADMNCYGVQRIEDVNILRAHQFREDAGPLAHPVRPDSYEEINNFYTSTVYNKGAEVIRMMYQILGARDFRRGCDLYFTRHDGCAVTTDDFVQALEDASGVDFTQFKRWYSQAGTPELTVKRHYDADLRQLILDFEQTCPATPGQAEKLPFHIPVCIGLLDAHGNAMPVQLHDMAGQPATSSHVVELTEATQRVVLVNVPSEPVPSLLRDFSAPVKLTTDLSDEEYCLLLAHDEDEFNRWDAGQQLAVKLLMSMVDDIQQDRAPRVMSRYVQAMRQVLEDDAIDPALAALILTLPSEAYLSEFQAVIDPLAIHQARRQLRIHLARELAETLWQVFERCHDQGRYQMTPFAIGQRSLRNVCLGYLMETGQQDAVAACKHQFDSATNMTDVIAALGVFAQHDGQEREQTLALFFERWQHEALVMDKWFSIQATSRLPDTLERVKQLQHNPVFKMTNPNKVRALIGGFCSANPANFHRADGAGYRYLGESVRELDAVNPQIAARLVVPLVQWKRYDTTRQQLMRNELEGILGMDGISRDVHEIITKSLNS